MPVTSGEIQCGRRLGGLLYSLLSGRGLTRRITRGIALSSTPGHPSVRSVWPSDYCDQRELFRHLPFC